MRFFPIFIDLDDQPVLMIGGGEAAAQKLRLLTRTGARLRVLAPAPCAEIVELAAAGALRLERRALEAGDLAGARLAYVALEDDAAAAHAAWMARAAGVPVNAIDRQELCDFITPAIVDRDPVVVAIGTEGAAPVLARQIKARLLPVDHPLMFLLAEPRRLRLRLSDALWIRVVDVEAALSARSYAPGPPLVLAVTDPLCPWNHGTWQLHDGVARRTDAPAELQLPVEALGTVYLGGFRFSQLAAAGCITELRPGALHRADWLFASTPAPWAPEIF